MNETQIHLRLPEVMHKEVQAYAAAYGTSVSAAVRILIRKGLAAGQPLFQMHAEGKS